MTSNTEPNHDKRALVISGGGARGAWGVGVAKALSLHEGNHYDLIVGTSTGSLMAPLVLIRDFDTLSHAYTSVTQKSIFNVNPFKKNGNINFLTFACRLLFGKKTLGETKNLLKTIGEFVTKDTFDIIKSGPYDFGVAVTSLTNNTVQIQSSKENDYENMKEWMWASANEPVFMTTVYKDGEAWVDGGLKDYLPITYAINNGAEIIDIVVHNGKKFTNDGWEQKGGIFDILMRTFTIYGADVEESNIEIAKLQTALADADAPEIKLNIYYMSPEQVNMTQNELIFDKGIMKQLLQEGYQSVVDGTIIKEVFPQKK